MENKNDFSKFKAPVQETIIKEDIVEDLGVKQKTTKVDLSQINFKGYKVVPCNNPKGNETWVHQKNDLIAAGLEYNFINKIPLVIKRFKFANLGKGCKNTLLFWFENQTRNHHFIANHYKAIEDADGNKL